MGLGPGRAYFLVKRCTASRRVLLWRKLLLLLLIQPGPLASTEAQSKGLSILDSGIWTATLPWPCLQLVSRQEHWTAVCQFVHEFGLVCALPRHWNQFCLTVGCQGTGMMRVWTCSRVTVFKSGSRASWTEISTASKLTSAACAERTHKFFC